MTRLLGYLTISLILLGISSASADDRLKVAIIDSGLDLRDPRFKDVLCDSGHFDYTGEGMNDTISHGTHVAGLVKHHAGAGNYCLIILKTVKGFESAFKFEVPAINAAVVRGAKFINMSLSGPTYSFEEYAAMKNAATKHGVIFIVAAGNNGLNLDKSKAYPASLDIPNMIVVGNLGRNGKRYKSSNYGSKVNAWATGEDVMSTVPGKNCIETEDYVPCNGSMTGTSASAPIITGQLVKAYLKAHK